MADAVWLAAHWERTGRTVRREHVPQQGEHWPSEEPPIPSPESSAPVPEPSSEELPVSHARALPTPDPEGLSRLHLGSPLLPSVRPRAPGRGARSAPLARALHRLQRRVPSRGTVLLDEELTAEQMVVDGLWMPSFRPVLDRAFDLVLLVDTGPTMTVWREETQALQDATVHSGAFGNVLTVQVDVPDTGPPALRRGSAPGSGDLGEIVGGGGGRVFLVVTDGMGRGWATAAADALLRRLGAAGPTAVVQLLPPHLRHRASLTPQVATLKAGGFGAPGSELRLVQWGDETDPIRPLPWTDGKSPVVPVLTLKHGSLAAWADLVVGEPGVRELPVVLAGSLHAGRPAPGLVPPRRPPDAAAAVRRFFGQATPTARRLATRLAATPFEFDLIQQLRHHPSVRADTEHLAEILMGGLIDWDHDGGQAPEFAAGVREALLAATTRQQLAMVVDILGGLSAAGEHGVALRAALRDPVAAALPDPSAGQWLRAELAVMRALSGPYAQRARRIESDGVPHHRGAAVLPPADGITPRETVVDRSPVPDDESPLAEVPGEAAAGTPHVGVNQDGPEAAGTPSRSPALMVNVPARNERFVGRTAQLRMLADHLTDHSLVCVLPHPGQGAGGVGKSELAREYVHRHAHEYDLVCWVRAAGKGLLLPSLAHLAARLDLTPTGGTQLTVQSAVPVLLEALRSGSPYDRWLLILDGADDVDEAMRHLPVHGPGKVLVTSRNLAWAQVALPVTLEGFEREETVALLRGHMPALPEREAGRLAEALGDMPLAVEQAGTWHLSTGMPVDAYVNLIHRHHSADHLLDAAPGLPVPLTAVWDIALTMLEELAPGAPRLLDVCAHLAAEPIPLAVFRAPGRAPVGEPLCESAELRHSLATLVRLSLLNADEDNDTVRLDRGFQQLLLAGLSAEEHQRTREEAHMRLAAAGGDPADSPAAWQVLPSLLPHLSASQAVDSSDATVRSLIHRTVLFLGGCGEVEGALVLAEEARAAWLATSDEEDSDVVRMTRTCASLLRRSGRVAESVPLSEQALRMARRVASDSGSVVASLSELAVARRHGGRLQQARELSEEAVRLARYQFGADHRVTLDAAHQLGVDLRWCGRFDEALSVDEENAGHRQQTLGATDPATLASLDSVNLDVRERGDYAAARHAQEDLHRRTLSVFGEEHPLTWHIADNLAVCRRRDGALEAAAELSAEALWRFEALYGPEHPRTLAVAVHASADRRLAGRAAASHQLAATTAPRLAARLGEDHPYTLTAQADLAAALRGLGMLDEAWELEEYVARRMDASVGCRHPMTLGVAVARATTAHARLDFERARDIDEATMTLLTETMGERHPLTLVCAANLALDHRGLGHGAEAEVRQRVAVAGFAAVLRSDHPWLLAARQLRRVECDVACVPL
ncbi:FxSxx-COOH system tetratricopeptide repeat protein [Streptomyces sp. NBC_01235]|uniref:FxSxx-COOH system tetratricopeptide repeat protein n=1 Tax=Streptomyces sp. NBC_01235 TaxID=2903788 RepID=UPI002E13AAA8|nr:FxSxx-COOH system tetratricopeptide repeat protein [Streptomyces sp. NBC_01235]